MEKERADISAWVWPESRSKPHASAASQAKQSHNPTNKASTTAETILCGTMRPSAPEQNQRGTPYKAIKGINHLK